MSRLVFFDLDGTLLEGSVVAIYMRELYKRKVVKFRDLVYTYAIYKLTKRFGSRKKIIDLNSKVGLRALLGKNKGDIDELINQTWGSLLIPRLYGHSQDLVDHYLEMGDIPVLLTAAPLELAEPIGKYLGFTEMYGSVSETDENNHYNGKLKRLAYGKEKLEISLEVARKNNSPLSEAIAYADSQSDTFLLESVGIPVAVNPDRRLLRQAKRGAWDILYFSIDNADNADSVERFLSRVRGVSVINLFLRAPFYFNNLNFVRFIRQAFLGVLQKTMLETKLGLGGPPQVY